MLLRRLRDWSTQTEIAFPSELIDFVRRVDLLLRRFDFCREPSPGFWRASVELREEWRVKVYSGRLGGGYENVAREELDVYKRQARYRPRHGTGRRGWRSGVC